MTDPRDDLADLAGLWRDVGPAGGVDVRRAVAWRSLTGRAALILECAISGCGLAGGLWLAWRGSWMTAAATLAFSALGLTLSLWARWRSWRVETGALAATVETLLVKARSGRRAAWAGLILGAAALLFLAACAVSFSWASASPGQVHEFLIAVAAALVYVAGTIVLSALAMERSRMRLERLTALKESMDAPD